ncbi:hypothetical protein EVAR_40778_1 [Eumeta japonica]|uniref:Uncharacterized protein n=1 Tax=Eumeta variegata TaxID=151549 RepID=A0A4C1X6B6_EUMVA|nr:hypothetical protein EVAR_40778_1 [Eumeta japonica]
MALLQLYMTRSAHRRTTAAGHTLYIDHMMTRKPQPPEQCYFGESCAAGAIKHIGRACASTETHVVAEFLFRRPAINAAISGAYGDRKTFYAPAGRARRFTTTPREIRRQFS